ncbi:MAG: hypothetical protein AAGJ80_00045 [Cyanobacteria bacterium J06553_1]
MTDTISRLIIARDAENRAIAAIDLVTQTQALIDDESEHYNFFVDCIGLDQSLADRYDSGLSVAVSMASNDWAAWLEHFHRAADNSPFVWLTASPEGNFRDYALTAMELLTKREIVAVEEKPAFTRDVQGWDEPTYQKNLSFVCRMSAEDWDAWLEVFEVTESLDNDVAESLTA